MFEARKGLDFSSSKKVNMENSGVYSKSSLVGEIGVRDKLLDNFMEQSKVGTLKPMVGNIELDDSLIDSFHKIKNYEDMNNTINKAIEQSLKNNNLDVTPANIQKLRQQIDNGIFDGITNENNYRKMVEILKKGKELTAKEFNDAFSTVQKNVNPKFEIYQKSSQRSLELLFEAYEESIDKGNMDALLELNNLINIKKQCPYFRVIDGPENVTSEWNRYKSRVVIDENVLSR